MLLEVRVSLRTSFNDKGNKGYRSAAFRHSLHWFRKDIRTIGTKGMENEIFVSVAGRYISLERKSKPSQKIDEFSSRKLGLCSNFILIWTSSFTQEVSLLFLLTYPTIGDNHYYIIYFGISYIHIHSYFIIDAKRIGLSNTWSTIELISSPKYLQPPKIFTNKMWI